jgi:hypothetical protein
MLLPHSDRTVVWLQTVAASSLDPLPTDRASAAAKCADSQEGSPSTYLPSVAARACSMASRRECGSKGFCRIIRPAGAGRGLSWAVMNTVGIERPSSLSRSSSSRPLMPGRLMSMIAPLTGQIAASHASAESNARTPYPRKRRNRVSAHRTPSSSSTTTSVRGSTAKVCRVWTPS